MPSTGTTIAHRAVRSLGRRLATVRRRIERFRVRTHLARTAARLRLAPPPDGVDPAARRRFLDELRRYRRRGAFPRNAAAAGRTPVFRDDRGVRCAVGQLAAADGHADVVQAVAAADNTVDLERHEPPASLAGWLRMAPLTRAEAARVQPTYGPHCPPPLSCAQLGLAVWSAGLGALFGLEWLLYRAVGRWAPAGGRRRRAGLVAGSVAVAAVVVVAGLLVWLRLAY